MGAYARVLWVGAVRGTCVGGGDVWIPQRCPECGETVGESFAAGDGSAECARGCSYEGVRLDRVHGGAFDEDPVHGVGVEKDLFNMIHPGKNLVEQQEH